MKPVLRPTLLAAGTSLLAASSPAAEIIKAGNTNNLNLGTSWVGGTAPGINDTAVFDDTFTSTANISSGTPPPSWKALKIIGANNPGRINVNNTTVANWVQVGTGGIDMSAAPRDIAIASFDINGSQTWNVAAGRTLNVGLSNSAGNEKITGSGDVTITGNGTVVMKGAGGGENHTCNITVKSGATLNVTANTALGTPAGVNIVEDGGSFVLGATGLNYQSEQFTVAGAGVGGLGVIQNPGGQSQNAFDKVILSGNATFSVDKRFDIRDPGRTGALAMDLAGFTLTKIGADILYFDGNTISSGDVVIQQGQIGMQNGVIVAANPGDTVIIKNGAALHFWRSATGTNPCVFTRSIAAEDGAILSWNGNQTADEIDQSVAAPIDVTGTLTINQNTANGSVFEVAGAISGSGGVTRTGAGILRLSAANTYTGPTDFQDGVTQLTGSLAGAANLAAAATLTGTGPVAGAVTVSGKLQLNSSVGGLSVAPNGSVDPGGPLAAGTISTSALALDNGDLNFDTSGLASTDAIVVAPGGTFTATGVTFVDVAPQGGWQAGNYELIKYSGGTVPPDANPNTYLSLVTNLGHATGGLIDTGSAVVLQISSVTPNKWSGATDANWDTFAANWQIAGNLYFEGDPVIFDDSATGNFAVNVESLLSPSVVAFQNATKAYKLSSTLGAGGIAGNGTALTKTGVGSVTIETTNSYTGGTTIHDGTLAVLRSATNESPSLGTGPVEVKAPGVLQLGINGTIANAITGDGTLLKAHPGADTYTTLSGANSYTGLTTVADGSLVIGNPTALGAATTGTYVQDDARLVVGSPLANASTINEPVTLQGGTDTLLPDLQVSNSKTGIVFQGQVTIENDVLVALDTGTSLTFAAPTAISYAGTGSGANLSVETIGNGTLSGALALGTGSLTKTGAGTLTLTNGANAYGDTNIDAGTLLLTGDGKLGSGTHTVAGGAFLGLTDTLTAPFAANLTGAGILLKTGAGNVELAAVNNLAGGTRIDAGMLLVGADNLTGPGTLHLNGGALASKDASPRSVSSPVLLGTNPAFGDINGALTGTMTYTGNVAFPAATKYVRAYTDTVWAGGSSGGGITRKLGNASLILKGSHDWSTGAACEIRQGTLLIDGGTVTNADAVRVMATDNGATARLAILNGGSLTVNLNTANLRLGYTPDGNSTGANFLDLGGSLIMPAGGSGGKTQLGTASTTTQLNLNAGGNLHTAAIQDNNAASNDVVNCDGGKLTVILDNTNTSATAFLQGLDAVRVLDGGLTLDTNGNDALVNQVLLAGGTSVGGITKQGAGKLSLGAANTYGGPTVVEAGTLAILSPGSTGAGATTVQAGATLAGNGTVQTGATLHGTLAPGTSAGALVISGPLTLAPDSSFAWEATTWSPLLPGINYDTVVAASLAITATAADPVTIVIAAAPAGFTETNLTFPIVQTSGGITGFDPGKFLINATAFAGSGTWSVKVNGNNLELAYTVGAVSDYHGWAAGYGLDPLSDGLPTADPDQDGIPNQEEYAFGLHPKSGSSRSALSGMPAPANGIFTYTRRKPSLTGLVYTYQSSTSLEAPSWTNFTPDINPPASDGGDPVEKITIDLPNALLANPKLFVRVTATGTP